jgi:hypothetical protein
MERAAHKAQVLDRSGKRLRARGFEHFGSRS